jgi:hypothetical protein
MSAQSSSCMHHHDSNVAHIEIRRIASSAYLCECTYFDILEVPRPSTMPCTTAQVHGRLGSPRSLLIYEVTWTSSLTTARPETPSLGLDPSPLPSSCISCQQKLIVRERCADCWNLHLSWLVTLLRPPPFNISRRHQLALLRIPYSARARPSTDTTHHAPSSSMQSHTTARSFSLPSATSA